MKEERFWVNEGNWYKGNLHTHTTNSDGALCVEEMIGKYRNKGYDFLVITDHNKLTEIKNLSRDGFLVIPGEEIAIGKSEPGGQYHLLIINLSKEINPKKYNRPQEVIDIARSCGAEVIIAHPYWSSLSMNDLLSLKDYLGIEIFNSSCFYSVGKGYSLTHWDDLLIRQKGILGFATDDSHYHFNDHRPNDTAVSCIMVKTKSLTVNDLFQAIRSGNFYSSMGPQIKDFYIKNKEVFIHTSPVKVINFIAYSSHGESFTAKDNNFITQTSYKLKGGERYIRIECFDQEGRGAWSNPIFI